MFRDDLNYKNYDTESDDRPDTTSQLGSAQVEGDLSFSEEAAAPSLVNYRNFAITTTLAVLLILGIVQLHDIQVSHLASEILSGAQQERESGRLESALSQYRNYLQLAPDDASARLSYLMILQDCAVTCRQRDEVYRGFGRILQEKPHRRDIRERLIDLLIQERRYDEASDHIEFLLEDYPEDGPLFVRLGQCFELIKRDSKAIDAYDSAVRLMPRELYAYDRLARLYLKPPAQEQRFGAVLDRLIFNNPRSSEACLLRARVLKKKGRTDQAMEEAKNAWQLEPDNLDGLEFIARLIATTGDPGQLFDHQKIRSQLESALTSAPDRKDLISAMARLDFYMGRRDRAEQRVRDALDINPRSVRFRWLYADFLVSQGKFDQARQEINQLRDKQVTGDSVDYLDARIDIARGKVLAGVRKLEAMRERTAEHPELQSRIHLLLGKCYEQLGHAERQLSSYRRAVSSNELSNEARIGLARSLYQLGRIEDALVHYQRKKDIPGVSIQIASLLLIRNMKLPPEKRAWGEFERALEKEARNPRNAVDILLLRCRKHLLENRLNDARELLVTACKSDPGQVRLWVALAGVELHRGREQDALSVLDTARQQLGNCVDILEARIRVAVTAAAHDASQVLSQIENDRSAFTAESGDQLMVSLAGAWEKINHWNQAERAWLEVFEINPDNLMVVRKLLSLAIRRNGNKDVQRWLQEIQRIEGPDGPHGRLGEAARYMMLATQRQPIDEAFLDRARELLSQLDEELPMSVEVSLLLAGTHALRSDTEAAVAHYIEAIDRSEQSVAVVRKVVHLLYGLQQFAVAAKIIDDYGTGPAVNVTSDLGRMASEVSLRTGKLEQAVNLARKYVGSDSQDYRDYLWFSQIQSASGRQLEAEQSLKRAIGLDRTQAEPWVAFVDLLGRRGRISEAEDAVTKMKQYLVTDEITLALAQCYESMGQPEAATDHYDKTLSMHPDSGRLMLRVSRHHMQSGRFQRAESILRRILDGNDHKAAIVQNARRLLALTRASTGTYPGFCEALELVNQNIGNSTGSAADLRTKARLLASRPSRRPRREAIEILELLDSRTPLSSQDQLQLIGLYEVMDDWDGAVRILRRLVGKSGDDPDYLAFGIKTVLYHGPPDAAAESWLQKLEQLQPDEFRTLELRVRSLIAGNRFSDALNKVHQHIDQLNDDTVRQTEFMHGMVAVLATVAVRFNESGRSVAAERITTDVVKLYRRLVRRKPECTVEFVRFLGARWLLAEAFEYCETAWKISPPAVVAEACVDLLRTGLASRRQFQLVRRWLQTAIEEEPTSSQLMYQAASAAHLAGQYARAEELYRHVIKLAPESTMAINELAILLALHRGRFQESTQLINHAIEISGPLSFLLDTRALINIAAGEATLAIDDLDEAISSRATADYFFHLAQAHVLMDHTVAARTAWKKSLSLGLHVNGIHPLEREVFGELELKLK